MNVVVGLAVLALLLSRQVGRRALGGGNGRRRAIAPVLALLGVVQLAAFAGSHHLDATSVGILCLSFAVCGVLGTARAFTVRLWVEDGRLFRQGTAATVALWLIAVGLHLGSDRLVHAAGGPAGAGSATLLLYLAASLQVQMLVLRRRARATVAALRARAPQVAAAG